MSETDDRKQLAIAEDRRDSPLVAQIRKLHAPHPYGSEGRLLWVQCHGCDSGPHPEDYPDWPCRTAQLVYSAEEIAATEGVS